MRKHPGGLTHVFKV